MPQPIDPFTELGRLHAVERIQQIADRASLAAQQRHQAEEQQALQEAERQVRESEQKGEEVDQELRRRNPFAGRRRKGRDGEQHADDPDHHNESDPDDPEGHHLDVTV